MNIKQRTVNLYVGLHDVSPARDVNFAILREAKMTAACNFISLKEKMHELLDKNRKKKKKKRKVTKKITDHMIGQK